jgi:hypothetical protein
VNFYQGLRIGVAVKAFCISAVCFAFLVRGAGAEDGWGNLKTVTRDRRGALVSVDDQVLVLADFRGHGSYLRLGAISHSVSRDRVFFC